METLEKVLHEEILNELGELKKLQLGSEEYKVTVEGVTKLVDRANELKKTEIEHMDRVESREYDYAMKEKQMEEDRKDRLIKNILTGAGIGIPAGLTVWGTLKSLRFEKDGTVTTILGRGFINKLLPKK